MALFSFTVTRKPRQFHYQPRYYDPRKEQLQAIISRAEQDAGTTSPTDDQLAAARIELAFREARARRKGRTAQKQMRRTLLIFGVLVLLLLLYARL